MVEDFEIRVISLVKEKCRREKIQALLSDGNFCWSFFDAISGQNIAPYLHHYDRAQRLKFPGHDLTPNEIACFTSHREVWKQCVLAKKIFLVLEDDASVIREGFDIEYLKRLVSSINPLRYDDTVIRLGHGSYKKDYRIIRDLEDDFKLVRYRKDPLCALAYLITPRVAEQLVFNSENFFLPVDDFMWNGNESKSLVLDIHPVFFSTPLENNPSTIGDRKKRKQTFFFKIKREFYRAIYTRRLRRNEQTMMQKALKRC